MDVHLLTIISAVKASIATLKATSTDQQLSDLEISKDVFQMAENFVITVPFQYRYTTHNVYTLFVRDNSTSVKLIDGTVEVKSWQMGLKSLLRYVINLLLAPNRPELKRIKVTTSYYVFQVQRKLKGVENYLLDQMGYKRVSGSSDFVLQDFTLDSLYNLVTDIVILHEDFNVVLFLLERVCGINNMSGISGNNTSIEFKDVLLARQNGPPGKMDCYYFLTSPPTTVYHQYPPSRLITSEPEPLYRYDQRDNNIQVQPQFTEQYSSRPYYDHRSTNYDHQQQVIYNARSPSISDQSDHNTSVSSTTSFLETSMSDFAPMMNQMQLQNYFSNFSSTSGNKSPSHNSSLNDLSRADDIQEDEHRGNILLFRRNSSSSDLEAFSQQIKPSAYHGNNRAFFKIGEEDEKEVDDTRGSTQIGNNLYDVQPYNQYSNTYQIYHTHPPSNSSPYFKIQPQSTYMSSQFVPPSFHYQQPAGAGHTHYGDSSGRRKSHDDILDSSIGSGTSLGVRRNTSGLSKTWGEGKQYSDQIRRELQREKNMSNSDEFKRTCLDRSQRPLTSHGASANQPATYSHGLTFTSGGMYPIVQTDSATLLNKDQQKSTWSCSYCSFANNKSHDLKCFICSQPKFNN